MAQFLRQHMHNTLQSKLEKQGNFLGLAGHEGKDIEKALSETFLSMDAQVAKYDAWDHEVGSCGHS